VLQGAAVLGMTFEDVLLDAVTGNAAGQLDRLVEADFPAPARTGARAATATSSPMR
jgi:hypothetical protein